MVMIEPLSLNDGYVTVVMRSDEDKKEHTVQYSQSRIQTDPFRPRALTRRGMSAEAPAA